MFLSEQNKIKTKLLCGAMFVVIALVLLGVFWFDKPVFLFFRQFDCSLWRYIEFIFDAKIWLGVFAVLSVWVYVRKTLQNRNKPNVQVRWFRLRSIVKDFFSKVQNNYSFLVLASVFCASLVALILKVCIGRFRPIFFEIFDVVGFKPFVYEWAFNSMPSGHTVASFAGLVMLGMLLGRKIKFFTWTLAIVIGLSRIAIGAHWPTDVLLGAFIGMVCADFVLVYVRKK